MDKIKDILIIGGGIFGCSIALELYEAGYNVTILEKKSKLLEGASKHNHNRIHYGYHYPRSKETTIQSLAGLSSFIVKYKECIVNDFSNYYIISKQSNVNSNDYKNYCNNLGIGYDNQFPSLDLINPLLIESSFKTEEPIFDYDILADIIKNKISKTSIKIQFNSKFSLEHSNFDFIINASYDGINEVNNILGIESLKFKLQDVVIPIFEYNYPKIGLTIMDGPFCSILPKGNNQNQFLLYNVKYSVINQTETGNIILKNDITEELELIKSHSQIYFPFLNKVKFIDYWRTVRALPINNNDSRISEIITYQSNPKYITVFSGKITTCIKIAKQIKYGLINGDFNNNFIL